jgi:hypothetical protein
MNSQFNNRNVPLTQRQEMPTLDIYIPRIDGRYTEEDVKRIFASESLAIVDYVDFVATKDPETKEIKFYSAFIHLHEWTTYSQIFREHMFPYGREQGILFIINITATKYWKIYPAKTTISRSKVNTHQLAAYTDELFVKTAEIEEAVNTNATVSLSHFQNLLAKFEEQSAQLAICQEKIQYLEKAVKTHDTMILQKTNSSATLSSEIPLLTLEDLEDEIPVKCEVCEIEFDTERQLYYHNMVCKAGIDVLCCEPEQPPTVLPVLTLDDVERDSRKKQAPCYEDECFLSPPLARTKSISPPPAPKKLAQALQPTRAIEFNMSFEEFFGPIKKNFNLTEAEFRTKVSKEFCGNS